MKKKENFIDSYIFKPCNIVTLDGSPIDSDLTLQIVFYAYEQFEEVHMHIKIFSKKYEEELNRYSYYFHFSRFNNGTIVEKLYDYSNDYNVCFESMIKNCNFLTNEEKEYYKLKYT